MKQVIGEIHLINHLQQLDSWENWENIKNKIILH